MPDIGDNVDDGPAIGLHRCSILTAGIIHESIDTAIGAEHYVDCGDHHRLVADIANLTDDHTAVLLDLRFYLRELFGRAPKDRDVGTKRRELMCSAATDAAAAARDNNRPAFEELRPENRLIRHGFLRTGRLI